MPTTTPAQRQEVINSLSTLEIINILNKYDVRSFASKDKVTGAFNGRVNSNFLAIDGKRYFLNRVQDPSKLNDKGQAEYSWVLGEEMQPKAVEVTQ